MLDFQTFKIGEIQPFETFSSMSYAYLSSQSEEKETFFNSGEKVILIFSP